MKMKYLPVLVIILLSSCVPQYYKKKTKAVLIHRITPSKKEGALHLKPGKEFVYIPESENIINYKPVKIPLIISEITSSNTIEYLMNEYKKYSITKNMMIITSEKNTNKINFIKSILYNYNIKVMYESRKNIEIYYLEDWIWGKFVFRFIVWCWLF